MIIKDEKVGEYCDGDINHQMEYSISCKIKEPHNPMHCGYCIHIPTCSYSHRSGGCVKHPNTIVLDCVCIDCYNEHKNKTIQ